MSLGSLGWPKCSISFMRSLAAVRARELGLGPVIARIAAMPVPALPRAAAGLRPGGRIRQAPCWRTATLPLGSATIREILPMHRRAFQPGLAAVLVLAALPAAAQSGGGQTTLNIGIGGSVTS